MERVSLRKEFSFYDRERIEKRSIETTDDSEAAVLETRMEGLSEDQDATLQRFDEQIEAEFRELDIIEYLEKTDRVLRDGADHFVQVEKIRDLKTTMTAYAMEHAHDPTLSALVMERADSVEQRLTDHLHRRANYIINRGDKKADDIL